MRRELILVFLAISAMIVAAFIVPLGLSAQATARDRALDNARAEIGGLVPTIATADPDTIATEVDTANHRSRHRLTVVVDGIEFGEPVADRERLDTVIASATSLAGSTGGGYELVNAVALPTGPAAVRVFVPDAELRRGVLAAWATLGGLGAVLILAAVALADRIAQRIIRPATGLARAAAGLGGGDFTVRVEPSGPVELAATAGAFNTLVERVEKMVADEREMVAELTHRLRTPLTRLRVGLDQVVDETVAAKLHDDLDLLATEVDDLISRARQRVEPPDRIDIRPVVARRFEFWAALAAEEDRHCNLESNEAVFAVVDGQELEAVIDALIENVFAHTPAGTPLALATRAQPGGGGSFTIDDGGPGFDPSLAQAGRSGAGSTGLGLAIAERLLSRSGGAMTIGTSPLGGARVECRFPAAS